MIFSPFFVGARSLCEIRVNPNNAECLLEELADRRDAVSELVLVVLQHVEDFRRREALFALGALVATMNVAFAFTSLKAEELG